MPLSVNKSVARAISVVDIVRIDLSGIDSRGAGRGRGRGSDFSAQASGFIGVKTSGGRGCILGLGGKIAGISGV